MKVDMSKIKIWTNGLLDHCNKGSLEMLLSLLEKCVNLSLCIKGNRD